jgi:glyoxylase-like metal-dependent hydrolase (beta-lactamase superfamily II)
MTYQDFPPGQAVQVAPQLRRITAPNASPLTGPGTNSYVLGDPAWAIVDPGPAIESHLAALIAAAPQARWCFVTHTHGDHSPLAGRFCAATGAIAVGLPAPGDGRNDRTFAPGLLPVRDQIFDAPDGTRLRAIDTPGHASNHVCYVLEPAGMLFSGDHVLDGVSPVILAPDGDMGHYLEALRRLQTYPLASIAPGHGRVLPEPARVIEALIAHRLGREAKVLRELRAMISASSDALLPRVYDDVPPAMHVMARYSLEAHLIKLERDGAIRGAAGVWHAS